jgi:hypothetical protein
MSKGITYVTNEARNAITALMRTLLRLGIINGDDFNHTDHKLAEQNRSHTVSSHPAIMPKYRVNKRR